MPNENVNETQASTEPVDIAQAFRMYNQAQRETAEEPVDAGEDTGEPEQGKPGLADTGDVAPSAEGEEVPDAATDAEPEGDDDIGGSSGVVEPVDYSPAREQILRNIQNQAINDIRKEMREQQIELWSIKDIYEKDENTGRVTFHNPDDPNHPFASRAEAQSFVDAMNKEVENHFRNRVNQRQQELVQGAAPVFQVIEYSPVYNAMNDVEKQVFDSLVEPYAIRDNRGNVIGFNTNLQAAGNVARNIAKNFQSSQPAQASQPEQKTNSPQQGSRPATDMPTGKSASVGGVEDEPKTLGEAIKMYDKMNRAKKEKK